MSAGAVDLCRSEFEAWYDDIGAPPRAIERNEDGYATAESQQAWLAWQAAWRLFPSCALVLAGEVSIRKESTDLCPSKATRMLDSCLGKGVHTLYAIAPGARRHV